MSELQAILSIFAENRTANTFRDIEKSGNDASRNIQSAFDSLNVNNLRSQLESLLNEVFTVNVNFNGNFNGNFSGGGANDRDNNGEENRENEENDRQEDTYNNLRVILLSVIESLTNLNTTLVQTVGDFTSLRQVIQRVLSDFYSNNGGGNQRNPNGQPTGEPRQENNNSNNGGASTQSGGERGGTQNDSGATENLDRYSEAFARNIEEVSKSLFNMGDIGIKSVSSLGDSFKHIGQELQGITSTIGGLVSIIGSSSLWENFIEQASERQTNQMMLKAKANEPGSTLDPNKYYTAINQKVIELPGNDQFLNQILTQIAVMEDYSTAEIEDMSEIIANYYMLARAKGQTNFETEKEIRNYVLTGSTKGLENSVLATEIKMLKQGNNIKERTIAIEKAMQNIHMDGLAKYETYVNSMETFVGHFQKASADIGEYILAILTPVIRLYNAIDDLTFEGLSASILLALSAIVGSIGALTLFGGILSTIPRLVDYISISLNTVLGLSNTFSNFNGLLNTTRSYITGIAESSRLFDSSASNISRVLSNITGVDTKDSIRSLIARANATKGVNREDLISYAIMNNLEASEVVRNETIWENIRAQKVKEEILKNLSKEEKEQLLAIYGNSEAEFERAIALKYSTFAEEENATATAWNTREVLSNTLANIRNNAILVAKAIYVGVLGSAEDKETFSLLLNSKAREGSITAKILDRVATFLLGEAIIVETQAVVNGTVVTYEEMVGREGGIISKIKETATRLWNTIAVYDETIAIGINTDATANEVIAKNLNITATLRNVYAKTRDFIVSRLSANATLRNIAIKLRKIAVDLWETVQVYGLAFAEQMLAIIKGEESVATGLLAGANILLAGSIEAVKVALGPIGALFDAIGISMYAIMTVIGLIVGGFLLLTNTGGSLDFLTGIFENIWNGITRIWDAFMNSAPVQEIITTFQNFAYTIESLFNFIWSIGGGIWELIFGVDNGESGGAFDIIGVLLEIVGAVGNFLYKISPLKVIVDIFNAIGSAIAWVLETWNDFVDSAEMQGLIKAFQDARLIIGEAFGEISEAFGEVWDALAPIGEALSSIFDDGSTEETTDDTNILLDVLKAFASVITTIVVPAVKVLVFPLRVLAEVIRTIADAISWVIGLFSNPGEYIGNLTNTIVNEFSNIPRRLIGMFLGLPGQLFGGLVDGVLNILGIHSPGYIQEAVVGEFLAIPSRILGGIGNVVGAVGNFASAIWNGFDSIFGTDVGGQVDGFINRLSSSFNKLKNGDIIGAVKDFGDNFLNTLDGIFGTDISGMVGGFFNQIQSNFGKLMNGDIFGVLNDTGKYLNDSIKRFTGVDLNQTISTTPFGRVMGWDNSNGLMQNPQNLITGQTLTQNYNNATTHSPTIVNNNFGEGSVQADARNMSAKDVQKMFTGAFGYNKARGTQGILK